MMNLLIISVDRDGDILKKVGIDGPIVGRDNVLDVAIKMGIADPTESDTNTLFETIRLYDKFKEEGKKAEVVALVGHENVGIESDVKINSQLEEVLDKFKAEAAVVVTDGAEDEFILPIIESRIKILSLRRVVVKQSESLESTYYLLKEIINDPKLSRLLIGVPAIAAILYSIFAEYGWRLVVGVVGVFLLIKGFGLEGYIERAYGEIRHSFVSGKVSFLTYIASGILAVIGGIAGYMEIKRGVLNYISIGRLYCLDSLALNIAVIAALVALFGKSIDAIVGKGSLKLYIAILFAIFAVRVFIDGIILFLKGIISNQNLGTSAIVGISLLTIAFLFFKAGWKSKIEKVKA